MPTEKRDNSRRMARFRSIVGAMQINARLSEADGLVVAGFDTRHGRASALAWVSDASVEVMVRHPAEIPPPVIPAVAKLLAELNAAPHVEGRYEIAADGSLLFSARCDFPQNARMQGEEDAARQGCYRGSARSGHGEVEDELEAFCRLMFLKVPARLDKMADSIHAYDRMEAYVKAPEMVAAE